MSDTVRTIRILHCYCKHPFQDKRYGKGRRVHNLTGKNGKGLSPIYRCTVCKAERGV